jgi:hypothetical protein
MFGTRSADGEIAVARLLTVIDVSVFTGTRSSSARARSPWE